ncbi:MAG: DUF58 domain-containing protein [Acetobacteraceae bacterium]|nr:DUF58 domain-containing protein [Acetobacteraceae bacterium]
MLTCLYSVDRRFITAGEALTVKVRLYNEGLLPLPFVEASDPHRGTAGHFGLSLGPAASLAFSYPLEGLRRGQYRLGPLRLRTGDPFGLFVGQKEAYSEVVVLVYPRLIRLERMSFEPRQLFGQVRTRLRAYQDPASLAEVRPFRTGDNSRQVHWRTSARKGRLFVKEYELRASCDLYILLDLEEAAHAATDRRTEDAAVEVAAAVAHCALAYDQSVAFLAYGAHRYDIPLGKGYRKFRQFMETLARVTASGHLPLAEALALEGRRLPAHSTVLAITPALGPELIEEVLRLRAAGRALILVLLKKETYAEGIGPPPARDDLVSRLRRAGVTVYLVGAEDSLPLVLGGERLAVRRA